MSENMQLMGILYRHLHPTEKQGDYLVPVVGATVDIGALASDLKAMLDGRGDGWPLAQERAIRIIELEATVKRLEAELKEFDGDGK